MVNTASVSKIDWFYRQAAGIPQKTWKSDAVQLLVLTSAIKPRILFYTDLPTETFSLTSNTAATFGFPQGISFVTTATGCSSTIARGCCCTTTTNRSNTSTKTSPNPTTPCDLSLTSWWKKSLCWNISETTCPNICWRFVCCYCFALEVLNVPAFLFKQRKKIT